jgi:predicted HTH transcriptional regulator
MDYHDDINQISDLLASPDFIKQISPKSADLTRDIDEIFKRSKDPTLVAVLLYKLVEERKETNSILKNLYDKVDVILEKMDDASLTPTKPLEEGFQEVLPEQDQMILHLVQQKGQVTADEIRQELGYKGQNAASQRLNKLFRNGLLTKIQAGRKVIFMAKN